MKADIKAKWIADLRSGKFPQTTEVLRNGNGYCCLGVLCDLYSRETGVEWYVPNDYDECTMHGHDGTLPEQVRIWAEIPHDVGAYVVVSRSYDEGENTIVDHSLSLTELNDSWEYNFHQIADVIEQQL